MFERVKKALVDQLELDADEITMDTRLSDDLGIDSLDLVELMTSMEDELGIVITEESLDKLSSVGDVVRFLERLA